MKPSSYLLVLTVLLAITFAGVADACPTCKEGLDQNGGNLVRGYFWSIMFMMSMPFLILSGLSGLFYWDVRRARQRQAEQALAAGVTADATS